MSKVNKSTYFRKDCYEMSSYFYYQDDVSYKLIQMSFYHRRRRDTRGNAGQRQGSWCDFILEDSRAWEA